MINKTIIHVPHPSLNVSKEFLDKLLLDKKEFEKVNILESDYLIDQFIDKRIDSIIFPYSRLMCDVERFKDDNLEIMSKYGRGVVYENTTLYRKLINIDDAYKQSVIDKYYDVHHRKLTELCKEKLEKYNECLIIDLHSFLPRYSVINSLDLKSYTPDICIGTNDFNKDFKLINIIQKLCNKYGYTSSINYPYSGSLVPLKYLNDNRIKSIMIEVNKDVYLNKKYNKLDKTKSVKLHKFFRELYKNIG